LKYLNGKVKIQIENGRLHSSLRRTNPLVANSPVITPKIKRWTEHVARYGGEEHIRFCWESLRRRDHLEDPAVYNRILKWIFSKWDGGAWTGLIWLRIGIGVGLL
jgi:hypothetical protein